MRFLHCFNKQIFAFTFQILPSGCLHQILNGVPRSIHISRCNSDLELGMHHTRALKGHSFVQKNV